MTLPIFLDIPYDTYNGWPLGHFLSANKETMASLGANTVHVQVENDYMTGLLEVPLALGLSTPIEILKGARVQLSRKEIVDIDVLKALIVWEKIHAGPIIKIERSFVFSSDRRMCVICQADYNEGDTLITTRKCGHIFHKACLELWQKSGKKHRALATAKIFQIPLTVVCPMCRNLDCVTPGAFG